VRYEARVRETWRSELVVDIRGIIGRNEWGGLAVSEINVCGNDRRCREYGEERVEAHKEQDNVLSPAGTNLR
jgi:hypothetical protein